jgi:F-type H+-transporting ATPase subunit epsilon
MAKNKIMHCRVLTPEGPAFEHEATSVVLPARDGQVGVLPDHCPTILLLGTGQMSLTGRPPAEDIPPPRFYLPIYGGFAEIVENRLTVLAEETGKLIKAGRKGGFTYEEHDDD